MSSEDINTQRVLNAVKKSVFSACAKSRHEPGVDYETFKSLVQARLNELASHGLISASSVRIIEDTPAEKLVREIMEEEKDEIRTEIEMRPTGPLTYLTMKIKIGDDS